MQQQMEDEMFYMWEDDQQPYIEIAYDAGVQDTKSFEPIRKKQKNEFKDDKRKDKDKKAMREFKRGNWNE